MRGGGGVYTDPAHAAYHSKSLGNFGADRKKLAHNTHNMTRPMHATTALFSSLMMVIWEERKGRAKD